MLQLSKSGAVPFSLLCDTIQRSVDTDGNDSIRGRCGPCESGKRPVGHRDGSCECWPVELSELWGGGGGEMLLLGGGYQTWFSAGKRLDHDAVHWRQ